MFAHFIKCAYICTMKKTIRFTEIYFDDAERLALYLSARENSEIFTEKCPSEFFPVPPKMKAMPKEVDAFIVGNYEIAYLEHREYAGQGLKYRNRVLHRVMLGEILKDTREGRGLSLQDLEDLTGIRAKNIENIEAGRFDATIDILGNIGDALGCHVELVSNDK